jgi:glyoxylase-like metal-dependent hydrolase (beta-lactamase superfamily II)
MKERSFGRLRFIPGENKGRYPFCHSLYIEGAGILIDPSSDRDRLSRLKEESGVKAVWLSHWHEDHIMHLDLFDDVPLFMSEQDAPMLSDIELFLDAYAIDREDYREYWRDLMKEQFHFKPRKPAGYLKEGQVIELEGLTVDVLHTPGHTPGHLAFFFREPGVLFLGDYDLSAFGPWYGDRESNIKKTIASVERLKGVDASIWIACHEEGIFEANPGGLWDRFLGVIDEREGKLLDFLAVPRTMDEIVNAWIVYRKPREPEEFFAFAEKAIMGKHLDDLTERGRVEEKEGRYYRV